MVQDVLATYAPTWSTYTPTWSWSCWADTVTCPRDQFQQVATKSHSQYEDALRRLRDDLTIYGHELPEVFYTDNMAHKPMLEKVFPSLLDNVTPVEKHAQLPLLMDPGCVTEPL
ncbi:hypothetical protein C8R46DRAFT_1230890 [Mycena filopes]|nr:hypothetical protein C8R46DRAFT_1230890 [Mycena filopes]